MSDVDDRIRGVLREIVAAAPDPPAFNTGGGPAPRPRPVRALVAAAVILAAAGAAVTVHVVADRRPASVPVIVAPTPTTLPATVAPTPTTVPVTVGPTPTTTPNGAARTGPGPGPAGFAAPLGPLQDSDASTDPSREGRDGVVVHLRGRAEQVRPGGTIQGRLQVINNTGHAFRGGSACRAGVLAPVIFGGAFLSAPCSSTGPALDLSPSRSW
jgi:hypothetical protein